LFRATNATKANRWQLAEQLVEEKQYELIARVISSGQYLSKIKGTIK